ncbi:MAG: uroporphyrinogen decarboxylase [Alphaproteobacteria bacterium]|nr:uroporphyrinogen decarboxylase [Alphaproteobacteria bacterium]MBT7944205.1 uroporphyrinogen decarboxylase [Alphaproteobacteria bacterium]
MPSNSKRMIRALKGEVLERPPFWLMRQAGRYLPEYREVRKQSKNFLDFCYSPGLAVEVTLQPLRRYHMDAAIMFCDILVIPDALGQEVQFVEGEGPVLDAIRTLDEVQRLSRERIHDHLAPVYETISGLAREIPEETALIGFAGAPWTVAVYMVEGRGGTQCEQIVQWADNAPDDFQVLMDLLVDSTADYLIRQVEHGAEILQLFDSWAGVLNDEQFRRWSIEPTRKIVKRVNENCPGIPVIGFPRNVGQRAEVFVKETGVDGVSLDQDTPLDWIAETLQPLCTVQGNLDNQTLVAGGDALDREVIKILRALSGGPYVFNLGHGVLQQTPPEHVGRVAELILGWPESGNGIG